MAEQLYGNLGSIRPITLLAGLDVPAPRAGGALAPGQGVVARGAIIYQDDATKLWKKAAAANIAAGTILAVCDKEIDTGSETTGDGFVTAFYEGGRFARGTVSIGGAEALTAAQEGVLRDKGFFVNEILYYDKVPTQIANTVSPSGD